MTKIAKSDSPPTQLNVIATESEPTVSSAPTDQTMGRMLPAASERSGHLASGLVSVCDAQDSSTAAGALGNSSDPRSTSQAEVHDDKLFSAEFPRAPAAMSSDDHDPVNSGPPKLPSRNHLAYSDLITSPYPNFLRENRSIIRFMGTVSRWFFYGGTLAGIIVLLYQRYIFPSLESRTRALAALTAVGLKSHTHVVTLLLALQRSCATLPIKAAKEVEREPDTQSTSGEKITIEDDESSTLVSGEESLPPRPTSPPSVNDHNDPIRHSLHRLADSLRRRQLVKSFTAPGERENVPVTLPVSASRALTQTLESLRADIYLMNMTYSTKAGLSGPSRYSNSFNAILNDPESSQRQQTLDKYQKAVSDLKSEMRGLKGMLLNRRNFASWNAP